MTIYSVTVHITFRNDEANQTLARALMTGVHSPYFKAAAIDEMGWMIHDIGANPEEIVFDVTEAWHVHTEETAA